jgi:hypothetical protein
LFEQPGPNTPIKYQYQRKNRANSTASAVGRNSIKGLLPIEWVNLDVFLQVEADFKGFLVNLMVMSSQARCAHAKIRQEETSAG